MKNLSRSGKKTTLEGGNDIRMQPIKTRLEVTKQRSTPRMLPKFSDNFTEEFDQQKKDSIKDAFIDIDERTQINDTDLHEMMPTSQAYGNNTSKGKCGCCYNFDSNEIDYERTMNNLTKRYKHRIDNTITKPNGIIHKEQRKNTNTKNNATEGESKRKRQEGTGLLLDIGMDHQWQWMNQCRYDSMLEKLMWITTTPDYGQKHNNANVNTDAKNRATRSETKKISRESQNMHKISNLLNLSRNIDFEKFLLVDVRTEYEQKQNNTNINTDAKNRAARSETKKIHAKVEKYMKVKILRIYAGISILKSFHQSR